MGITSPLDGIPAEGIGGLRIGVSPLEMSSAYATLAAGGIRRDPVAIRSVVFPDGRVEKPEKPEPRRVVSEAVAYEVTQLLHDNITEGTGTAAYTGCEGQAGKTGTTDGLTDAWFAGFQPNLSTVVWVGYPESNEIEMTSVHGISVFGGTFPADIWHAVYTNGEVPCETFSEPENPIVWAPFYGRYTRGGPTGDSIADAARGEEGELPGQDVVGGYDPNAYAPGVGQEPYEPPALAPAPGAGPLALGRRRRGKRRDRSRRRKPLRRSRRRRRRRLAAERRPRGRLRPGLGRVRSSTSACSSPRRRLGPRPVWAAIGLLVTGFALAPVLLSHDVYSYVDYARLAVVHGLDPYVDPPYCGAGGPRLRRGRLDRRDQRLRAALHAGHLPLAWLPVGAAVAALKALAAAAVLGIAFLVARLAPARGVDPVRAAAFVALNPLVLVHVVGGAHNDGIAMLLAMLGVAAVLARRELAGGAALAAALAVKAPAAVAAPFALLAAHRSRPGGGRRFAAGALRGAGGGRARRLAGLRLGLDRVAGPGGREPGPDEPHERADHLRAADRRRRRARPGSPRSLYMERCSPSCSPGPGAAATGCGPPPGPPPACCSRPPGCFPGT